jgi:hypothetical protein
MNRMNSYMDRNVAVEFKFKKYDLNSRNAVLHIMEFNTSDLNLRKQFLRSLELVLKLI